MDDNPENILSDEETRAAVSDFLPDHSWECFTCWTAFDETQTALTRNPETSEPECIECRTKRLALEIFSALETLVREHDEKLSHITAKEWQAARDVLLKCKGVPDHAEKS